MTVNEIPEKTKCECNHAFIGDNDNVKDVIYLDTCKNENCECKRAPSIAEKDNELRRLELTGDLLTGISEIDNQHRELFNKGNAVLFPGKVELGTRDFADALVFIVRYVEYHFLAEEDAMERCGYDRTESHKKQHQRLQEDIGDLLTHAKQEGPTKHLKLKFHYFFSDWFTYHIKHTDRAFADFLRDQDNHVSVSLKKYDKLRKFGIPIDDLIGETENASVEFVNIKGIEDQPA